MAWKYYSSEDLCQLLDISEEEFHRNVKRLIKADFKVELAQIKVKNPDILLTEDYRIVLADPRNHIIFFETDIEINSYI